MCGRFALGIPKIRLEETLSVSLPDDYAPRYNIAPGTEALVVEAGRASLRRFGLVPHWARDVKLGYRMINARSETVFDKPAFREPVRSSRCLVPVQAFYEWKKTDAGKQPYAITPADGELLALAGIASHWENRETGEVVDSFAILTCQPNEMMAPIHDRMPIILSPDCWGGWLDPAFSDPAQLAALLVPCPAKTLRVHAVSPAVNFPANDDPDLLRPWKQPRQRGLFD